MQIGISSVRWHSIRRGEIVLLLVCRGLFLLVLLGMEVGLPTNLRTCVGGWVGRGIYLDPRFWVNVQILSHIRENLFSKWLHCFTHLPTKCTMFVSISLVQESFHIVDQYFAIIL